MMHIAMGMVAVIVVLALVGFIADYLGTHDALAVVDVIGFIMTVAALGVLALFLFT